MITIPICAFIALLYFISNHTGGWMPEPTTAELGVGVLLAVVILIWEVIVSIFR